MAKEKVLVIGLGEIGYPIFELLRESGQFIVYGLDIDPKKMQELEQGKIPAKIDIMHICIPSFEKEQFVKTATDYIRQFKPRLVIIDSTIPPMTTLEMHKLGANTLVAHSPVRGVHRSLEYMKFELKRWIKYVGGASREAAEDSCRHFEKLGMKTKILKSPLETELAKLFETTYRALMIAWFQEMHRISRRYKADFDDVVDFIEDTHRIRFDRPVMFPNVIGKHCLIPNIELLLEGYDSELLRLILKSNEKRKEEIRDKNVLAEVRKIERRATALENDLISKNR